MWHVERRYGRAGAGLWVLAMALGGALPARAALGEPAGSVPRDHQALRGTTLTRTAMPGFEVHEITTGQGIQVRQYVSPQGTVFAAAWEGPSLPDLKVILGGRYPQYAAGAQSAVGAGKVFSLDSDGLLVRVVKLPRGLAGSALLSALLPPGTRADDIR